MRLMHALGFVVVALTLNSAALASQIYKNSEFGIVVPVPNGALLCVSPNDEHDHGPLFLLGTSDVKQCPGHADTRSIGVFASYNAADDSKHLPDFLQGLCTGVSKGRCHPAPKGLNVSGLTSASATVKHRNGWIDIIVATQAGAPDPDFDSTVPFVNYSLILHTTPDHLAQDLSVFRTVLKTIRLSPGNPRR